jgi:HD-GYP domain-containing protein (c-di-GMP phosphodiesterase class II)
MGIWPDMARDRSVRTRALGVTLTATGVTVLRRSRAARVAAEQRLGSAIAERDRLRRESDHLRLALRRREVELVRRAELLERLHRGRRAERDFNRELRTQLQREQALRGGLDDPGDPRDLILRAAIKLVEAEKGLLLSRRDADGDGRLDMVCAHGFAHDPSSGAVVQRFAREVLERDRIVREDTPPEGEDAADAEIDNLVAIPLYLLDRFEGVIVCANRDGGFEALDDDLLLALGDHASAALHNERLQHELTQTQRAATRVLVDALDARDPVLRREAGDAALLARSVCHRLGIGDRQTEVIATAALLRDIGYIAIPERILHSPDPLAADERTLVEIHPRVGSKLIAELPGLADVATTVLYHHERVNGTGYPAGLEGEAIPYPARVLAVVDAYVGMTNNRPYRPPLLPEEALAELGGETGTHFDPLVVRALGEEVTSSTPPPEPATTIGSGLDTAGLPPLRQLTGTDPLTLLPGHRAFHEAAARSVDGDAITVAIVQLEELAEVNRRKGYAEGDHALLVAARATQLAAARVGGTVYRESGRRFALLVTGDPSARGRDLAAELHTEFALGPSVRVTVATGHNAEDVIARARAALNGDTLPPTNTDHSAA